MRLYNNFTGITHTLADTKFYYVLLKAERPELHDETFSQELRRILTATIHKQNDLSIIGITRDEVKRIIAKLEK